MRERRKFKPANGHTRAILYTRVSTEQQVDRVSLEQQAQRLRAECVRRGISDYIVIEDAGYSGGKLKRPGLSRALRLLGSGERDLMLATHLDRLARDAYDVLFLARLCREQGWNMVALEGELTLDTTTAVGEVTLTVMAALAQFQRRQTQEKIRSAYAHKRTRGDAGLIDPDLDARIVRLYRDDGLSMGKIADPLNTEGVPTARGGTWHASTVWRVIERA